MKRLALIAFLAIAPFAADAEIYKWVDEDGVTHYSDRPAKKGAERADLKELQVIESGALRRDDVDRASPQPAEPDANPPELSLERPRPDETFRAADSRIPVSVAVTPSLGPGQQLVYRVDGRSVAGGPTKRTSLSLDGLARGSHTLQVSLVAGEREITRSGSVTFHVKTPSTIGPTEQPNAQSAPAANQTDGATTAPTLNNNP